MAYKNWLRLDASIITNKKIEGLTPTAKLLYIAGLCEARDVDENGLIPATSLKRLALFCGKSRTNFEQTLLVSSRLWEKSGKDFRVVNWSEYQSDHRNALEQRMAKDRERQARFRETHKVAEPETAPGNNVTNNVTRNVTPNVMKRDSNAPPNLTVTHTVTDNEIKASRVEAVKGGLEGTATAAKKDLSQRKKTPAQATPITDDWQPAATVADLAEKFELPPATVAREVEKFRDYWLQRGEPRADWSASLRTWLRRTQENGTGSGPPGLANGSRPAQYGRTYQLSNERLAAIAAGDD